MPSRLKVSCPHMGSYTDLITKEFSKSFGWEVTVINPSQSGIELGARHMNELMCLPAKVTLGGFIEAAQKGVRDFLMFDSCGDCRLKSYWILQQRALKKLGYDATVYPVRLGKATPGDIRRADPSISTWKAWRVFLKTLGKIRRLDRELWHKLGENGAVRIGLVGEIFSILEPAVNRDLIKKLEKLGVEVHNSLPLSYFIFKEFYNRGWMERDGIDRVAFLKARALANEYFPKESIGGHGKESIIHTIYYALRGFDGVIHVLPFPCAPESTVAPIIEDIGRDYSVNVMRLTFDTHTAEAGLVTRLEAFTDMLKRKGGARWPKKTR